MPPSLRAKKQASNRYQLFVVKLLLVLLILFMLPELVESKSRATQRVKRQNRRRAEVLIGDARNQCEKGVCVQFLPEESMNCVQFCISPACYQEVYGDIPIEDGEIDVDRALNFDACAKNEMKEARKLQRTQPNMFFR